MGNLTANTAIWSVLAFADRAFLIFIHFNQFTSPDETCRANMVAGDKFTSWDKHLIGNFLILG